MTNVPLKTTSSAATTPIGDGFLRVWVIGTWALYMSQHRECPCTKLDVAAHLGRLGRPFRLRTIGGSGTCKTTVSLLCRLASFPWHRGCLGLCACVITNQFAPWGPQPSHKLFVLHGIYELWLWRCLYGCHWYVANGTMNVVVESFGPLPRSLPSNISHLTTSCLNILHVWSFTGWYPLAVRQ